MDLTKEMTHELVNILDSRDWDLLREFIVVYGYDENTEELAEMERDECSVCAVSDDTVQGGLCEVCFDAMEVGVWYTVHRLRDIKEESNVAE
jgi:hypothetical protein